MCTKIIVVIVALTTLLSLTQMAESYNQDGVSGKAKRIYTIAHGHDWGAYEYIDNAGFVTGFTLDLIAEVCAVAGIDCRIVWEPYTHCIKNVAGQHSKAGVGIIDGWYDACAGWVVSVTRQAFAKFSYSYLKPKKSAFYMKTSDNTFDAKNWWNYKIGFVDGWVDDEKCLSRVFNKVLPIAQIVHYKSTDEFKDAIVSGTVDAGHAMEDVMERFITGANPPLKRVMQDYTCMVSGSAMMSRKESDFPAKWNEGFTKLVSSGGFKKLCEESRKKHNAGAKGGIDCV